MLKRLLRCLLLALLVGGMARPVVAANEPIVLLASDRSPAFQEAAEAFLGELERLGVRRDQVQQAIAAELSATEAVSPRIYVTLGSEALQLLLARDVKAPVLATLLPRASYERLVREAPRRTSALSVLYLNQSWARQMDLLRLVWPRTPRVGVLLGSESAVMLTEIEQAAQARGIRLVSSQVRANEGLFPSLKKLVDDTEVLLAVPDSQVYSSSTLQNILLTTFRARVPMVAFSPAYVRAGAMLGLYSTPAQIGVQAAGQVHQVLQGKSLPPFAYPQDFIVTVNDAVAHSLGYKLDGETLKARLRRLESQP